MCHSSPRVRSKNADESFPDKPLETLFSEECEVDQGKLERRDACPVEDKPSSAPKERAHLPPSDPSVGLCRARTAEETPVIQRARRLELQRLAIERKELQAQLAEVKQLMRASKVRGKAAPGGLLGAVVGDSPRKPRGRTSARRGSKETRGGRGDEQ